MKSQAYNLFPLFFLVLGFLAYGVSAYILLFGVDYTQLEQGYQSLVGGLGFLIIGLILTTFRGRIEVDKEQLLVYKEYRVAGILLSRERIRIPKDLNGILVQKKEKQGRGYVQGVVGFSYQLQARDLYFATERGLVKILSTDHNRAIRIAEFLGAQLGCGYSVK